MGKIWGWGVRGWDKSLLKAPDSGEVALVVWGWLTEIMEGLGATSPTYHPTI